MLMVKSWCSQRSRSEENDDDGGRDLLEQEQRREELQGMAQPQQEEGSCWMKSGYRDDEDRGKVVLPREQREEMSWSRWQGDAGDQRGDAEGGDGEAE